MNLLILNSQSETLVRNKFTSEKYIFIVLSPWDVRVIATKLSHGTLSFPSLNAGTILYWTASRSPE